MIPEINFTLRTPEEVEAEREKVRRGKCIYKDCGEDCFGTYKLCREHSDPFLQIIKEDIWKRDALLLRMMGYSEQAITKIKKGVQYE